MQHQDPGLINTVVINTVFDTVGPATKGAPGDRRRELLPRHMGEHTCPGMTRATWWVFDLDMNRTEVWLVRHGETDWSASGRHTGRTDLPLNDAGRIAAKEVGARLAGEQFDLLLTSPMKRALDTCELAGFSGGALATGDLSEWDYGKYEGITTDDIRLARPGWNLFTDGAPDGELPVEVAQRADHVIAKIRETEGRAIVFAHGHILRVLGARWCDLPVETGAHLSLGTASISTLGWEREVPVIKTWNT
jgi:probable phosphoglycerate mutase